MTSSYHLYKNVQKIASTGVALSEYTLPGNEKSGYSCFVSNSTIPLKLYLAKQVNYPPPNRWKRLCELEARELASLISIQSPVVDYINKMLRYLLEDLCEKVYNGPNSVEFRDSEIERIRLLIRPYLGSKN